MTRDELIAFRSRRPFMPFRVVLNDGDAIDITKPTSIGFGLTKVHLVYPDRRHHKMVRIDDVATAQLLERVG